MCTIWVPVPAPVKQDEEQFLNAQVISLPHIITKLCLALHTKCSHQEHKNLIIIFPSSRCIRTTLISLIRPTSSYLNSNIIIIKGTLAYFALYLNTCASYYTALVNQLSK